MDQGRNALFALKGPAKASWQRTPIPPSTLLVLHVMLVLYITIYHNIRKDGKHMAGSFTALYYHCVFSTKNREQTITEELRPRLYEFIGGLTRERRSRLLACNGIEDHLHLLVSMNKELTVPAFLRDIKSNSSLWIHQTFSDRSRFAWQEGYGAFTVSVSALEQVKAYIEGQREHHQKRDFKTEFLALLNRHGVKYDERYIWR